MRAGWGPGPEQVTVRQHWKIELLAADMCARAGAHISLVQWGHEGFAQVWLGHDLTENKHFEPQYYDNKTWIL